MVRLLSAGINESAILNWLPGEQIADGEISEADSIMWRVDVDSIDEKLIHRTITGSTDVLRAIRDMESIEWDPDLVTQ